MKSPPFTAAPRAPASRTSVVAARGIKKAFKIGDRELEVLHGVDFELYAGELLGLMGASGAGKSTLLQVVGLLDAPTSGEVFIDGRSAWRLPVNERAKLRNHKIGFVFQFYHLLPELDAVENVLLPAMIDRGWFDYRKHARELKDRARGMLVKFGLEARLAHRPAQLSGGERQRVAIARALAGAPECVLADEPTGNLDRETADGVFALMLDLARRQGMAFVMVTHDPGLAGRCDRVLKLKRGRLVD